MALSRPPRAVPSASVGSALVAWFGRSRRPLPWRRSHDPYSVWVAEVMLQQTRVAQAAPYYERFLARFPTVRSLARAPLPSVLKAWQGAGYYARARNLHAAARQIVTERRGIFPQTVDELETLPGVGPYIARAIAAIAFDLPVVALEANGRRVAARWWAERGDVRSTAMTKRLVRNLEGVLPSRHPGRFTEALMELGETVCLPSRPDCPRCPVREHCRAYSTLDDPGSLPRRHRRPPRPSVVAAVVVVESGGRYLVQRRAPTGLLGGLYEFPGGKLEPRESPRTAARREWREEVGSPAPRLTSAGVVHHAYSHFTVELHVFGGRIPLQERPSPRPSQAWVRPEELMRLPLPRATEKIAEMLRIVSDRRPREPSRRRPSG